MVINNLLTVLRYAIPQITQYRCSEDQIYENCLRKRERASSSETCLLFKNTSQVTEIPS